jgi:hypothetical protein
MRLLAVVNRFDLRNLDAGDAGEGRLVFRHHRRLLPFEATMIFEYKLPAATEDDVRAWADRFHALGSIPFGEDYNAALQELTETFVASRRAAGARQWQCHRRRAHQRDRLRRRRQWQLREFVLVAGHREAVAGDRQADAGPQLQWDATDSAPSSTPTATRSSPSGTRCPRVRGRAVPRRRHLQ